MLRKIPWPWIGLYATLALFGAASYFKWYGMWGINHLAFLPNGWWVVYWLAVAAITALALLREPTPCLDRFLNAIAKFIFDSGVWPKVTIAAGFMLLFWVFRTPTHFLGDGYALLGGLGRGETYIIKWTEPGAVLLVRFVQLVLGEHTTATARGAFQILSILSGGVVVYNAIAIVRYSAPDTLGRLLTIITILLSGSIVLFCGYVEFYPALLAFASTFFLFAIRYINGANGPVPMLLALVSTCLVHLQALVFLPGAAFALLHRELRIKRRMDIGRGYEILAVIAGMGGALAYLWMYSTRIEFETMFLPLFSGRPRSPEYAVFSVKHVMDIVNLLLLICPLILPLMTLAFRRRRLVQAESTTVVLWLFAGGALLFLVLVDPVLGMARDWDLMSLAVVLVLSIAVSRAAQNTAQLTSLRIMGLAVVGACVAFSYVSINASADSTESRYHELLRHYGTKNRSGWSILANYHRDKGDPTTGRQIIAEMEDLFPEDRKLGSIYKALDRQEYDVALRTARELVQFDPYRGDYYQVLANAHARLGQYDSAEVNYRVAIKLIPYQPMIKNELGQLYLSAKRYSEAQEIFNRILDYDRSLTMVSEGLALAYFYQGQYDSAVAVADTLFSSDPDSPGGHLIHMIVSLREGDTTTARGHYESYLISGKARSDYQGIRHHYQYLMGASH